MHLAFLHTAASHIPRFETVLAARMPAQHTPPCGRTHLLAPALLARAMHHPDDAALAADLGAILDDLAFADALICTCTTLGPIASRIRPGLTQLIRVDAPMMREALGIGPDIRVAVSLRSAAAAALSLLDETSRAASLPCRPSLIDCTAAWRHFEAGDMAAFEESIALQVRADAAAQGCGDVVLLAQASMQDAAARLCGLPCPVLSAPGSAVTAALARAPRPAGNTPPAL